MLLARVADQAYWAGRYLERVEDLSRVVQVHGETHVDLPVGADVGWLPLLEIFGLEDLLSADSRYDHEHRNVEAAVVRAVVTDRDQPGSILGALASARENLRVARPVVPREAWELVNELWHRLSADAKHMHTRDDRVAWLRRAIDECVHVNGVLVGTMRRDEAMAFICIGQQLERADIAVRVLSVRADSAAAMGGRNGYDEVHWMALLRSMAAYQPFRRAMPARPDASATLRFLLQDEAFPRAVSSCLSELRATVKRLPGNEEVLAACTDASVLVAAAPVERLTPPDLRSLASTVLSALATIHDRLNSTYFRPVPTDPERPLPLFPVTHVGLHGASSVSENDVSDSGQYRTYRVRHRTTYTYEGLVEQAYNEAHLRPRPTNLQQCLSHVLEVEPEAASRSEYVDAFGNAVSIFIVKGSFDRLSVTATSDVRVAPSPSPPPSPPWESARWLLDIDRQAAARAARRFRAPSRLVPACTPLTEYAQPSFAPGRPILDAVMDLSGRIHREFRYQPGFTSVTTPVLEILECRRGVCQDFAHLAIGCVRSMGLAARYVSGYLETVPPDGERHLAGADASHAWFSVFVPGWGWVDLDPTNDQMVSNSHITTAWGRDYWDVSPLRGSLEGGGSSHSLEVAVDVTRLSEASVMADGTGP